MENQLSVIVKESGLDQTKATFILTKFQDYFEMAANWEAKAKTLVVTSETQTAEMQMAKTGRLFLRKKRIDIEEARKELKEQSLREGKAIDGIANVLKALIIPIEEYLEKQEKFAELKEAARLNLLREEEAKKAEAARIEAERAAAAEQERIRAENARLKKEADEREAAIRKERAEAQAAADKLRKENEAKLAKQREEAEMQRKKDQAAAFAEAEKVRKVNEAKIAEEKAARAKVEAELKAKRDKEEADRIEKELKQEEFNNAADKVKLAKLYEDLKSISLPSVNSKRSIKIVANIRDFLTQACAVLKPKG